MQSPAEVPVLVHLSGSRRGLTQRFVGSEIRIGTAEDAEVRLPPGADPAPPPLYARLTRSDGSWRIRVEPGRSVWLNGRLVEEAPLASEDLIEVGKSGPVLRWRLYPQGEDWKSMAEAFSDCLDCARHASPTRTGRAARLLAAAPRELATQTAPWFRVTVLALLTLLVAATAWLVLRTERLETRVAGEEGRLEAWLGEVERGRLDREVLRQQLEEELGSAGRRLQALEERSAAAARIVPEAARSVAFLQGAYGFVEPASGRYLRYLGLGEDGAPLTDERGAPAVSLDGAGPVVESLYTGTAFVATADGLLLTNRHVARPWEFDETARRLSRPSLRPAMRRFLGYLPGTAEPFPVELVAVSDAADLAILRCALEGAEVPPLQLAASPPGPGDAVIVLGYPAGIRAVVARADPDFLQRLMQETEPDFWSVARALAAGGYLTPLASQGIIGQRTSAALVYDAATFQGGSGGPVLDLDGHVVAVNAAILPEFGGSNLGVPAAQAAQLMAAALRNETTAPAGNAGGPGPGLLSPRP